MKTVLITGANSVLGKTLSNRITSKYGWRLIKTTRTIRSSKYEKLNVRNKQAVYKIIKQRKPDLIFHLAATYSSNLSSSFKTNVLGAEHLLNGISKTAKAKKKIRLVLIGSAAEYGKVLTSESPVKESQLLRPISIYGLTKAWQTQLGLQWSSVGYDVVVARVFNLMGSGFSKRLFIGHLENEIRRVKLGEKKYIQTGSLDSIRDYIHVNQAVDQIMAIGLHGTAGEVYNVGSGKAIKIRSLLKKMLAKNKLKNSIVKYKKNKNKKEHSNIHKVVASISKINKLMKSTPE